MTTPIWEFLQRYRQAEMHRLHMPGHKGTGPLGCEQWDITEIQGADSLYEAAGILAESEGTAAALFGSGATFYSTGGSSQCGKAMLHLALQNRPAGTPPVILAARNVHKSFVHAAALLDFEPVWLWPEEASPSLCACPVTPEGLEAALDKLAAPPAAVYVTSPDYLGGQSDVTALAEVSHRHGVPLLADNAHGAYLRFLSPSRHPMDLGADLCCDSAHKTLPVLTGGAYLHVGRAAPEPFRENARRALALFGSTSPSYLTLQSLDLCNRLLAEDYPRRLAETVRRLADVRSRLRQNRWAVWDTEPLKVTVDCAASGWEGPALAQRLREGGVECEYCDRDDLVLMGAPENPEGDFRRLLDCLGENRRTPRARIPLPAPRSERACSIREAMFRPHETVRAEEALGRICGTPAVGCPPAIPIAAAGERIGGEAIELFVRYGAEYVDVLR